MKVRNLFSAKLHKVGFNKTFKFAIQHCINVSGFVVGT